MGSDPPAGAPRSLRGWLLATVLVLPCAARAQADAPRLSKDMRLAVDMYRKGDDLGAMDRFMEILVKGEPAERSMANDYLNRITHRMATGSKLENPPPAAAEPAPEAPQGTPGGAEEGVGPRVPVETVVPESGPAPAVTTTGVPLPPPPADHVEEAPPRTQGSVAEDRKAMKDQIDEKIHERTRDSLEHLKRWDSVQVRMANSRLPRAIGFPSSLLFSDGMSFRKDAADVLDAISDLVFSLGATQVVILPEGALLNDAKILDMRRTMAISAQMMKAGVAPARLRVNLLNTQVDIPPDLQGWRGVLIVFEYNQPLDLSSDSDVGAREGPPVSLGVSPDGIDPAQGEGTIIEMSVMEPPAGLSSWDFRLLGPGAKSGADMEVLQEVKGSAPVFHQIYWNGRKRYFGDALPGGRYQCVLTATDGRRRTA
ncbi:MAG: hypothetical protein KGL53_00470, partial [Elusimicrobia bacterium]|nr:hypothetical protein [Elusimicrobiota bacterium]